LHVHSSSTRVSSGGASSNALRHHLLYEGVGEAPAVLLQLLLQELLLGVSGREEGWRFQHRHVGCQVRQAGQGCAT
jgi:hypothetical protein